MLSTDFSSLNFDYKGQKNIILLNKSTGLYRVIPNHFNKSLLVTLSELDKTWYVSSTCGFMIPDKICTYLLYGFLVKTIKIHLPYIPIYIVS